MATTAAPQGTILKQANEHPNFTSVAHVGHNCMGIIILYTHDGNILWMHATTWQVVLDDGILDPKNAMDMLEMLIIPHTNC